MDDTAQSDQNKTNVPVSDPSQTVSVGSVQKEQEPVVYQELLENVESQGTAASAESSGEPKEEYIKPSEIEPSLSPEVAEAGVEVSKNHKAASFTKQTGIEPAKESTPVLTSPSGTVLLPMTEKEALRIIKTTSVTDSKHWFAFLIEKIYGQLRWITGKK